VDPLLFGQEPIEAMGIICPERDAYELSLTRRALALDMPILAICRGIQVLNIAAGGNILQDIGAALKNPIKHEQKAPTWYGTHSLKVLPGSKLAASWGEQIVVNSFHHQAVDVVADEFRPTAWSSDGVIEAIESPSHRFVLGVQCHPECMWEKDARILSLFKQFVQASVRK
jgi:putative glutamine amidotransferase